MLTYLNPGDGVPTLPEPERDKDCDCVIFVDNGRSVSESIRGLMGGALELRPSSSSSISPVIFGDEESRESPSICNDFHKRKLLIIFYSI